MFKVNEFIKAAKAKLIIGSKDSGIIGVSIDSRTIKKDEAFIAIKGKNFDGHNFIYEAIKKGAGCIITEHNKLNTQYSTLNANRVTLIEVKDTIKALGDIARAHRKKFDIPIIGVTGSNGKTTTKDMLAWVLADKFKVLKNMGTKNNQIGLPQTLLNLNNRHEVAVLELGTNHFGEIKYLAGIACPNMAIITNIGPSHLEHLRSLAGVLKEKYSLMKYLQKPKIGLLNADDLRLRKKIYKKNKDSINFGFAIKTVADFTVSNIRIVNRQTEFIVNRKYKFCLRTLGYNNVYNALSVIAAARILGMDYKDMADRFTKFDFPEGRLKLKQLNNIRFIDDTYNSNPASLRQALAALGELKARGRKIFVMGDMLELGDHRESFHRQAARQVAGSCDIFISVGRFSKLTADSVKKCNFNKKRIFVCSSVPQARDLLFNKILPDNDDIILVKGSRSMHMEGIFKG